MRQNLIQTAQARRLRQSPNDAEKLLWGALRNRRLHGLKFRRQVPIGPVVVDFLCAEQRLIVQVDGGQRADSPADRTRDTYLTDLGFRVFRVPNADIHSNLPGILQGIAEAAGHV